VLLVTTTVRHSRPIGICEPRQAALDFRNWLPLALLSATPNHPDTSDVGLGLVTKEVMLPIKINICNLKKKIISNKQIHPPRKFQSSYDNSFHNHWTYFFNLPLDLKLYTPFNYDFPKKNDFLYLLFFVPYLFLNYLFFSTFTSTINIGVSSFKPIKEL
jgi:hypothetical protein